MTQSRNNLKKVLHSVEMDHILAEFLTPLVLCIIGLVVGLLFSRGIRDDHLAIMAMWIACAAILTAFSLWRGIRICRKPGCYVFCSAKLSQPHHSIWRNAMYFTVVIEDTEGNRFPANTHAIFFTYSLTGLFLEDYINKTVEVGYNEETGQVVVIG